jgi:hypothetical protein
MARTARRTRRYFLFALRDAELARTLVPGRRPDQGAVRAEAAALGLPVAAKPESMEVCFVPDGDAAAFVDAHAPRERAAARPVVDEAGTRSRGTTASTASPWDSGAGSGVGGGARRYVTRDRRGDRHGADGGAAASRRAGSSRATSRGSGEPPAAGRDASRSASATATRRCPRGSTAPATGCRARSSIDAARR